MDISVTNGDSSSVWRSPSSMSTSSKHEMRTDASRNPSASNEPQQTVPTHLPIGSTRIAKPLHLQRLEAALDLTLLMRQVQSFIGPNVKLAMPSDHKHVSSLSTMSISASDPPLKPSLKSIKAKSYNLSKVKKSKRWIKNVILDGQLSSDDEDEETLFKSMTASGLSRASLTKEGKRKKKKEDDMVNDMIKFNNFTRKFKKELEEKKAAEADGTLEGPVIPKKYERYSYSVMNNSYVDQPLNPVKKEKKAKVLKEEPAVDVPVDEVHDTVDGGVMAATSNQPMMDVAAIKQEKVDAFPLLDIFNATTSVDTIPSVQMTTTTVLLDSIPYDTFLPDEILESESVESNDQPVLSQTSVKSNWDMMANVKIEAKPEVKSDNDSVLSSPSTSVKHFKDSETSTGHGLPKSKKKAEKSIDDPFDYCSSVLDNLSPGRRITEFDDEDSSNHSGSQNSSVVSQTMSQPPLRSLSLISGHGFRAASATISRPSSQLSSLSQPDMVTTPFKSLTAPPTPTGLTTGSVRGLKRLSSSQPEYGSAKKRKKGVEMMREQRRKLWMVISTRDVPRAWSQMKSLQKKFLSNRKLLADGLSTGATSLRPHKMMIKKEPVTEPEKVEVAEEVADESVVQELDTKNSEEESMAAEIKVEKDSQITELEQILAKVDVLTETDEGRHLIVSECLNGIVHRIAFEQDSHQPEV